MKPWDKPLCQEFCDTTGGENMSWAIVKNLRMVDRIKRCSNTTRKHSYVFSLSGVDILPFYYVLLVLSLVFFRNVLFNSGFFFWRFYRTVLKKPFVFV